MRLPGTLILPHFSQWQRKLGLNCYQQSFPQFGRITGGARGARLHLPPDSDAFSTTGANQFTGSALQDKSGLSLKWCFPPRLEMTCPRVARRCKLLGPQKKKKKSWGAGGHNCWQRSPHALPVFTCFTESRSGVRESQAAECRVLLPILCLSNR